MKARTPSQSSERNPRDEDDARRAFQRSRPSCEEVARAIHARRLKGRAAKIDEEAEQAGEA